MKKRLIIILFFLSGNLYGGTVIAQAQRVLAQIKAAAAASASVPALRQEVENLADEVQKLKDVQLGKTEATDD